MAGAVVLEKDPRRVEIGRLGALKRWGAPRRVRLDALTPAQRALVVSLIEHMGPKAVKAGGDDAA
jgi:hypothetical protein